MPKKWSDDTALVGSLAGNLMEALPLFPKRLVHVDALVREHQMPYSHIQILVLLSSGVLSIGEISDRLGIAKPNITPLVDSLHQGEMVERVRDEHDRRIVNVRLLPKGEEKLEAIRASILEQVSDWRGQFSRSEMKELNTALASMIRIVCHIEV